jgi:fumarate reductase flavoprotein subunit
MRRIETDVVVIGGGASGLSAAVAAAEHGARVVVFEKQDAVGAGMVKGGNGPFAVDSRMQQERQFAFTRQDAFQYLMDYTHWTVDARLVSDYINRSASTVEWLEKLGVKFNDVVAYFIGAHYTWHYKDSQSPAITDALSTEAKRLGATFVVESPVKKILKERDWAVGVVAENKQGEEIHVIAKAVIVATGGFAGNAEWIKKYTGYEKGNNLFSFGGPELAGDGIRMAWEAGAGASEMMMQTYISLPDPFFGPGGTAWELGSFRQPNLMVNLDGERFMNEEVMRNAAHAGNAVHRQKQSCGIMIFDEAINRYYEENNWDILLSKVSVTRSKDLPGAIQKARSQGYKHLFLVNSMDELAAQAGIDREGLRRTIEEYNRVCTTGQDEVFHKQARLLRPVKTPRFYAARFYLGGYGSLGGIKVNYRMEAVSEQGDPISGLYAVGRDANSIYGGTYVFAISGNDTAFDFNSGRIAGENAAKIAGAH